MFGLSRFVALLLAFCLGFSVCGGVVAFGTMAALNSFRVRDIEKHGLAEIPDEYIMGDNPEVDLLNLSVFEFVEELGKLRALGDDLNINTLQKRYDLKIHHDIDKLLSDEVREMPISKLFSDEGIHTILSSVYIGHCENYECHAIDSAEEADPALGKELTRWYDPVAGEYLTGINATIAYFTLEDFAGGGIHVDSVLDGIILADVLGYSYKIDENGKKVWYDGNGEKVSGVMAVFADSTVDQVSDKINTVAIGDLIGYEADENGVWYQTNEETGELEPVSNFMTKIADSSISNIDNVFSTLQIGDIVDEEEREKGIFSIIPADTEITAIDSVVNDSITGSPMQFFMNQGMITFEAAQLQTLDDLCVLQGKVEKFSADDETFIKYYKDVYEWATDGEGNYLIPAWRDQPLSSSFSYIVGLLTPTTSEADSSDSGEI